MFTHFTGIFIKKLQNKESNIVLRAVNGFNQFAPDGGKRKIKKIDVCLPQIINQRRDGNIIFISI